MIRATVMGVLLLVGRLLDRETSPLNSLALAGLLILLWRPHDLWDPGFQLSFAATVGILALGPATTRFLSEHGCPRWLAVPCAVSLGAQLAVTPIMLILGLTLVVGIALGVIGTQLLSAQQEPIKRTVLLKTDLAGMEGKEGS